MNNPKNPAGPGASEPSQPEDSGSEFGATGIFGAVAANEAAEQPAAGSEAKPRTGEERVTAAATPQPAPGAQPFPEPVVHKVVFGGGAAESSPNLLDRMRMESAKQEHGAEKAPPAESGGRGQTPQPVSTPGELGGMGFTQLLRTLGNDSPAPAVAAKVAPAAEVRPAAPDSGFTSLLRTLGSQETAAAPVENSMAKMQPAAPLIPEEPRRAPAAAPGSFTELLRITPAEAPEASATARPAPAPVANQPGTFTQLFSAVEGAGAGPSAPPPATHESAGSFTRMLAIDQRSAPAGPAFREERKPATESLNYGLTPEKAGAAGPAGSFLGGAGASRDPFSPSPTPQPQQELPPAAGVGITRLIRMLDEPTAPPAPRAEAVPASPPQSAEPGVWTQTFASLATPDQPAAPAAKAPEWSSPQASPAPPPFASAPAAAREAQFPGGLNEPAVNPSAAGGTAGPSEFTRILDASRMREMAMKGGQVPGAASPPQPPPPQAPAMPQIPSAMPNYSMPPMPSPTASPGMGAMPPQYGIPSQPAPQMPAYPMSYPPQAGMVPGSIPQPPAMPAVPALPPAPTAPQAPPVQPGVGKLQQMVPLLLVIVIVLLVALLVTVIFMMKH